VTPGRGIPFAGHRPGACYAHSGEK
jgi:hypothetical protein